MVTQVGSLLAKGCALHRPFLSRASSSDVKERGGVCDLLTGDRRALAADSSTNLFALCYRSHSCTEVYDVLHICTPVYIGPAL